MSPRSPPGMAADRIECTQERLEAKLSVPQCYGTPIDSFSLCRPWRFVTMLRERWKYPSHQASNRANSKDLNIPYCILTIPSFFCKMAKKTDKKKGRSAINEVVTREYTINVHKRIHGMWVVSFVKLKKKWRGQCNDFITCILTIDSLEKFLSFLLNPLILFKF